MFVPDYDFSKPEDRQMAHDDMVATAIMLGIPMILLIIGSLTGHIVS